MGFSSSVARSMLLCIAVSASAAVAQQDQPRRVPPVDVALSRLDDLSYDLTLTPPQAKAFAVLRAAAAKLAAETPRPAPRDPFSMQPVREADDPISDSDRVAFRTAGSAFFATLDEPRRAVVAREWPPVLAAFLFPHGGPRGRGRRDRDDGPGRAPPGGSPDRGDPPPPR